MRLKAILISCYKKILLFFIFSALSCKASLLWDIQEGINFLNRGEYLRAKNYFINYLANNPNDEAGYYYLGRTYLKLKDTTSALNNFEKSYNLALREKNLEKINFKDNRQALNDYFDMAVMYFEESNFQEADFYADLMLKLNDKDSNAWFLKAKIANARGEKEEAIKHLNRAILYNNKLLKTNLAKKLNVNSAPPVSKDVYYKLAFEEYYKGNVENAIRNCTKYTEFDNNNIDINILLSELYLIKSEYQKALFIVENSKKTNESIALYLTEAKIYEKLKDFEKQKNTHLKAYKINPNNSQMLYALGNFYLKQEDYKNSINYFEALVNTDDSFYEGYFGYIINLVNLSKFDTALNFIRKAGALNNEQSEINYILSLICFKQGQYEEAQDYIKEAISKQNNPNYLLLKSQISYYQGKYEESLGVLENIRSLNQKVYNPQNLDEFFIKNYLKLKKYQNAQAYLERHSSALDKNSLLYKYNLYNLYKLNGDNKKAETVYNQIKSAKYIPVKEYQDLSEIIYEKDGLESAIKVLDKAIKKMPDEAELYCQKIKIYTIANEKAKAQEVLDEMFKKFN